jgi:predicted O-linked N-acetylglucosamine transferase (SPINDLY family)
MLVRLLKQIFAYRAPAVAHDTRAEIHRALAAGDLARADNLCARMLGSAPADCDALQLAGIVALRRGDVPSALDHMTRAAALGAGPQPCLGLGRLLHDLHRIPEAIEQYRKAAAFDPALYDARIALANALYLDGDLPEAETQCRAAMALRPDAVEPLEVLALVLYAQARIAEVAPVLRAAQTLAPADGREILSALLMPAIYQSVQEIEQARSRLADAVSELLARPALRVSDPVREVGVTPFYLAYHGMNDRDLQRRISQLCRKAYRPAFGGRISPHVTGGKIRVGFVSEHFNSHSIGRINHGIIAHLDRTRFEVTVFSLRRHDDALARRIRAEADHFVEFDRAVLQEVERVIADHRMDILFYTDVGMDPFTYFLAYSRLAPLQYVGWGHPDTTGIDTLDFFVSADAIEVANAADHYTETLVRLPKWLMPGYERPPRPDPLKGRRDFGLADDAHIYLCFQHPFKLHPDFDEALAGILRGDALAEILLLEGRQPHMAVLLRQRFAAKLPDVASRIRIVPQLAWHDYLSLISISDVMLDPFHFGGGNTTYEGLAMGVPVVTLPPQFLRGRHTLGCYLGMEMDECIADSVETYVKIALRLGMDGEYGRFVRAKIAERCPLLYGNGDMVDALGDRFEADYGSCG